MISNNQIIIVRLANPQQARKIKIEKYNLLQVNYNKITRGYKKLQDDKIIDKKEKYNLLQVNYNKVIRDYKKLQDDKISHRYFKVESWRVVAPICP